MKPSVTWVSLATPGYAADMARLIRSTVRVTGVNRFMFTVEVGSDQPFRLSRKFSLLQEALRTCATSHLLWIDADCEIVAPLCPADVIGAQPLVAVRHFHSDFAVQQVPEAIRHRMTRPDEPLYWQACLFGGERRALETLLDAVRTADPDEYDEHTLNIELNRDPAMVHTLPCRFASPGSFAAFPHAREEYYRRAGGPPVIMHYNKAVNS